LHAAQALGIDTASRAFCEHLKVESFRNHHTMAKLGNTEAPVAHRRPAQVALLVAAAFFHGEPGRDRDRHGPAQMALSFTRARWISTWNDGYMLTLAVFIRQRWIADRLGARTYFLRPSLVHLRSCVCGFSNSPGAIYRRQNSAGDGAAP